jgi:hypothetical protein
VLAEASGTAGAAAAIDSQSRSPCAVGSVPDFAAPGCGRVGLGQAAGGWETFFRFSGFLGVSALILVAVKYSGNSARIYWQLARIRTEVKDSLS